MRRWRIEIPPRVAELIRHLPPEIKAAVREALRGLAENPRLGEPLQGELEGLLKFRVRRYRVVYAVDRKRRRIEIYAVGHRRGVYEAIVERER